MLKPGTTRFLLFFLVAVSLQGCYSFTGGSIPAHLKTIAIPVFDDRSGAGIAQLRSEHTKALVDKIESQSPLRFTPSMASADALLEGTITSFSDVPGQLSGTTERALTNRITLVVQVTMTDHVKKTPLFTQSFVGFADYYAGNYVAQQQAIAVALGQINEAIFDRIVSGW